MPTAEPSPARRPQTTLLHYINEDPSADAGSLASPPLKHKLRISEQNQFKLEKLCCIGNNACCNE